MQNRIILRTLLAITILAIAVVSILSYSKPKSPAVTTLHPECVRNLGNGVYAMGDNCPLDSGVRLSRFINAHPDREIVSIAVHSSKTQNELVILTKNKSP